MFTLLTEARISLASGKKDKAGKLVREGIEQYNASNEFRQSR